MQQDIFFSFPNEIKPQKTKTQEPRERKFEEKVREKGWLVLIFI